MKLNSPSKAETVVVRLNKNQHPIAWEAKKNELMKSGMTDREAEVYMLRFGSEFVMELHYAPDQGLFLVESEAIESTPIYNPYDGTECEVDEDEY